MTYSIYLALALATAGRTDPQGTPAPAPDLTDALAPALARIRALVEALRQAPLSPQTAARFEQDLRQATRELGRLAAQWAYNHLEPDDPQGVPAAVDHQGSRFRRLAMKTPQQVSTLLGTITLRRRGYRAAAADGEPVSFPLCRALGLVQGATPALVERVAHYQAEGGATQQQTLARLRAEHGVAWGVKRLRQVTAFVAAAMEGHRAEAQAEQVLRWLAQAQASRGPHRPVLSVGRDGITLGLRLKGGTLYEVATTGTLTVYDRRGRRLGTAYLAYTPEPGQGTMSAQLTRLVEEVLRRCQGPLPRLSYVTAAGDNETAYYRKVLRRLRHPRTGARLEWTWVVDYYHASERLWAMAEALFGSGRESWAWVRKMQKLLLKRGGRGPGVALGGRAAQPLPAAREAAGGLPPGLQVPASTSAAPALRGVPARRRADRQRGDGGGVQDGVHAAAEAVGDALAEGRCADDPDAAGHPVERGLGASL